MRVGPSAVLNVELRSQRAGGPPASAPSLPAQWAACIVLSRLITPFQSRVLSGDSVRSQVPPQVFAVKRSFQEGAWETGVGAGQGSVPACHPRKHDYAISTQPWASFQALLLWCA